MVFSLGGKQDHLLNLDVDRHADVFPDEDTLAAAGYTSQDSHDLLCVLSESNRVGIPANNIPAFNKRLAGRTFGQVEQETPATPATPSRHDAGTRGHGRRHAARTAAVGGVHAPRRAGPLTSSPQRQGPL